MSCRLITSIHLFLDCIAFITLFYALGRLCFGKALNNSRGQTVEGRARCGIIITICIIITAIISICCMIAYLFLTQCYYTPQPPGRNIIDYIWITATSANIILTLVSFFEKLKRIFIGTPYEISMCTTRFFRYSFGFLVIFMIMLLCLVHQAPIELVLMLSFISMIIVVSLITALIIIYFRKLIAVYKASKTNNPDDVLISEITKTTILYVLSVTTFILRSTELLVGISEMVHSFLALFDVWTNFAGVILCYHSFEMYYKVLCRCTDNICRKCLVYCIHSGITQDEQMMIKVQNMDKHDTKTTAASIEVISTGDEMSNGNENQTTAN